MIKMIPSHQIKLQESRSSHSPLIIAQFYPSSYHPMAKRGLMTLCKKILLEVVGKRSILKFYIRFCWKCPDIFQLQVAILILQLGRQVKEREIPSKSLMVSKSAFEVDPIKLSKSSYHLQHPVLFSSHISAILKWLYK